jgi:hypothetical protein
MRSLGVRGDQETVLSDTGISTYFGYLPAGVELDALADVARTKLKAQVSVVRDLDLSAFREHLRRTNDPSLRYVVNFSRGPLFGDGGGHFSPIAGYLSEQDLVLVLDVNAAYRPWLVRAERLYEAVNTLDRGAGKKRGLLIIASAQ